MKQFLSGRIKYFLALFCIPALFLAEFPSEAAAVDITVKNGDRKEISVFTGDTGRILPDLTGYITEPATEEEKPSVTEKTEEQPTTAETAGNQAAGERPTTTETAGNQAAEERLATTETAGNQTATEQGTTQAAGQQTEERPFLRFTYEVWDEEIISVNEADGTYTALHPGTTTVDVYGYEQEDWYNSVFTASITITVSIDMTNVTLSKNELTGYMIPFYYNAKKPSYSGVTFEVAINSSYIFNDSKYDYGRNHIPFDYYSTNKKVSVNVNLSNNVLTISASAAKKANTVLVINLNNKTYHIPITLKAVGISDQSCLLVRNKTKKLKISGYSGLVKWKSSNKKVATVSAKGVVKGKKIGNCVITAKVGDGYVGCAVSITTSKIKKVVTYGSYMGKNWKYSQAKRTQKGYYDCSALVWKAYTRYTNINFGSPGYPAVAFTEAKWCNAKNRMVKGGYTYKKISKMQINPGDLLFKSSDMKDKYKDVYHVEMATGYYCYGVYSDGTPVIDLTWAARGTGYGGEVGSLLGRPIK